MRAVACGYARELVIRNIYRGEAKMIPLQITWRDMDKSEAVETSVREHVQKLDQICDHINSCRVVIEAPHHHKNKGNIFHISIDITAPGKEIAVTRDPSKHQAHEDMYVAIRDAFNTARRQLQEYARKQRGDVKTHAGET